MTQTQKTRRQMLEEFVAANPGDAFGRYGLAMECSTSGDADAAIAHFRRLLEQHPQYVSGYHQLGLLLARLGRNDEARQTLDQGAQVAERAGNSHARDEMQDALRELD